MCQAGKTQDFEGIIWQLKVLRFFHWLYIRGIAWVTDSPSTKWTWLQSMFLTIIHDFLILISVLDLDILSQESFSEDGLGPKFYEKIVNFYIYLTERPQGARLYQTIGHTPPTYTKKIKKKSKKKSKKTQKKLTFEFHHIGFCFKYNTSPITLYHVSWHSTLQIFTWK